jgi:hypothetical protein
MTTADHMARAQGVLDECFGNPDSPLWHHAKTCIATALAAAEARGREQAAQWHDKKAEVHARGALWIGRNRERWEGVPPEGVEAAPMNGPAVAYQHEIGCAAAIRAIGKEGTPDE